MESAYFLEHYFKQLYFTDFRMFVVFETLKFLDLPFLPLKSLIT